MLRYAYDIGSGSGSVGGVGSDQRSASRSTTVRDA
jgi:hypothetical protein